MSIPAKKLQLQISNTIEKTSVTLIRVAEREVPIASKKHIEKDIKSAKVVLQRLLALQVNTEVSIVKEVITVIDI